MLILQKGHKNEIESSEADRLAKEASKKVFTQQAQRSKSDSEKFDTSVANLEKNVQEIKQLFPKWENLKTLKARVKVSKATTNLNKQMAEIDSSNTVSMLERMKEKVQQEEALAEAYGDIASASKSIDEEIDKAADVSASTADEDLAKLKIWT